MGKSDVMSGKSAQSVRSPIIWALLGLVIQRPSYGYELVQRFERTYAGVLDLSSPSQIYTALDSLSRKALVEEVPPPPREDDVIRQPKPHYGVTGEGLRNYEERLIAQLHDERRRSHLFALQLALLPPRAALGLIERYEQTYLKQARATPSRGAIAGGTGATEQGGMGGLVAKLVGEEDRLMLDARLAWIDCARRELKALVATHPPAR